MKHWIGFTCAIILLASCASFPKPGDNQNSLIVGNIVLEFPDGFFSDSARRIVQGIQMNIRDFDENKLSHVLTGIDGYYYFVGKPDHKYVIESWEARIDDSSHIYSFGPNKWGLSFNSVAGKVIYLQNVLFTFRRPKRGAEEGYTTHWNFKTSVSTQWNPDGVRDFIEIKQKKSGWLDLEFVQAEIQ